MTEDSNDASRASKYKTHISRTCGMCGKTETNHWLRHWENKHEGMTPFELGTHPLAVPTRTSFGDKGFKLAPNQ